ncbi:MAG: hypothetical protein EXQ70_08440 [Solirubrobacterales bacterium]|nr:hypothetical protein [Solirubrobacterales bacterium]
MSSTAITPDQRFLYATNYAAEPGIAIFARNRKNGSLKQLKGLNGCVSENGTTGTTGTDVLCRAVGYGEVFEVGIPDNRFVYIPDRDNALVGVLKRNKQGGLVKVEGKAGCISEDGSGPEGPDSCAEGRGIVDAERVVLSPDRRFLFLQGYNPTEIASVKRNTKTGALSQKLNPSFCITEDGSSADGADTCQDGRALDGGYAGALSADGKTLYYANYSADSVVVIRVNRKTGAISQLPGTRGCFSDNGSSEEGAGTCTEARSLEGAYQAIVGPGGRDVYVAASGSSGISRFRATVAKKHK